MHTNTVGYLHNLVGLSAAVPLAPFPLSNCDFREEERSPVLREEIHKWGLCPILDLRYNHLRHYKIKMLTVSHLLCSLHSRGWYTWVDLTDAYFHITNHPAHRKFLRFSFEETALKILFGLSLVPRIFTKCAEAVLTPLSNKFMRVFTYLDDLLLTANRREQAVLQTQALVSLL